MIGDWFKLHRKIIENPIFNRAGLLRLWIYCLSRANWKKTTILMGGMNTPIEVERGSFVTGINSLHSTLYGEDYDNVDGDAVSARTLWRWLHLLAKLNCITIKTMSNRFSIVTVINYDTYQNIDDSSCHAAVTPLSRSRHAAVTPIDTPIDTPVTTEEEHKEHKEHKEREEGKETGPARVAVEKPRKPKAEKTDGHVLPSLEELPGLIRTPECHAVLATWLDYKTERKQRYKSKKSLEALLQRFSTWSSARFVAAVNFSISQDWNGIYEEKTNHGSTGPPGKAPAPAPKPIETLEQLRARTNAAKTT